jgi:putative nucleotidyltransferase with HDIG domain
MKVKKTVPVFLHRFQLKVTIACITAMVAAAFLGSFLVYRYALRSQFEQLRSKLTLVAQTAALTVDIPSVEWVMANRLYFGAPAYDKLFKTITRIKNLNHEISSVYIFCKSVEPGFLEFVADSDPPGTMYNNEPSVFGPGKLYDARRFPALLHAFERAGSDDKIESDLWQKTLSGYAPLCNNNGQAIAVIGVDVLASDIQRMQREVDRRVFFVFLISLIFSILVGQYISYMIARPVQRLVKGINHITSGNLEYQITVDSYDEIGILANAFNTMARSLCLARRKLNEYFYNVMISFVTTLEEKDEYTKGHSERVSKYSEQIARRMGFIADKVDLFKNVAMLHDVGKIGIASDILNKTTPLTEGEWIEIKKHPAAGAKILKSLVVDEGILSVVRSHHERVDGNGYPDRLKGDNINIFTSIVTVADAYDAMTSDRAYRKSFSQEEAIVQLKQGSGVQFDQQVVDTFVNILEEEQRSV